MLSSSFGICFYNGAIRIFLEHSPQSLFLDEKYLQYLEKKPTIGVSIFINNLNKTSSNNPVEPHVLINS